MADAERYLLYTGIGFFGMLFLMSKFSVLRPKALSMNLNPEGKPAWRKKMEKEYSYPPKEWIGERPS